MDNLDFWALQRSVQERFVASTEGAAAPAPLAIRPLGVASAQLVWIAVGVVGLLGAIVSLRIGFGDLSSRYALSPLWFSAVHAGFFALGAFGFFKAAARYVSAHAVPYRPAVYLFPIGVIDARTPRFVVHRVSEQTEASVDDARRCLHVVIDGVSFDFQASDLGPAERAARMLLELRDRLANAGPDSSAREQSLVDPLVDNGFKNPFAPTESLRKALPLWVKAAPLWALILGVLLGGAAWRVRNRLSEARLYAAARAADDTATYRTYLARGGRNPDVPTLLLPRTELRAAVQRGTVAAIEAFGDTHPNTEIEPEVDAALQAALRKELNAARASGSLGALKEFGARYARFPSLQPALDAAIDARIETALQELRPALAANQPHLLPFIERLLRFSAKHGPKLEVRFELKPTETLDRAEKALRKNPYFGGEKSLPGQYFDAAHEAPREASVAAALVAALNEHLPRDLLDAQAVTSDTPAANATADAKRSVPTLLVTYHTEMSGAFISRKPRFALSGIGLITRTILEIPDDPDPIVFKLSVWRAPDLKDITDTTTPEGLYDTMATEAFRRYTKKYLGTMFVEK